MVEKKEGPSSRTGRGGSPVGRGSVQPLIRSRANYPGPEAMVVVRVVAANVAHATQRNGERKAASIAARMSVARPPGITAFRPAWSRICSVPKSTRDWSNCFPARM